MWIILILLFLTYFACYFETQLCCVAWILKMWQLNPVCDQKKNQPNSIQKSTHLRFLHSNFCSDEKNDLFTLIWPICIILKRICSLYKTIWYIIISHCKRICLFEHLWSVFLHNTLIHWASFFFFSFLVFLAARSSPRSSWKAAG